MEARHQQCTLPPLQHLDWSALEYIRWRYEIGEDREGLDKVDRKVGWGLEFRLQLRSTSITLVAFCSGCCSAIQSTSDCMTYLYAQCCKGLAGKVSAGLCRA